MTLKRRLGNIQRSFWPWWLGVLPFWAERGMIMARQATVGALGGLLHDLTDDELLVLTDSGNRPKFKEFLAKLAAQMWRQVSYDQSLGLTTLIERAVGPANLGNINRDITQERFPLNGADVRKVDLRVEPFLEGETSERATLRLTKAGHTLASTGDLAGFLHDHPEEVAKWSWVLAIGEDSRWARPDGRVFVPFARVVGASRNFLLDGFHCQLSSRSGVLVSSESGD